MKRSLIALCLAAACSGGPASAPPPATPATAGASFTVTVTGEGPPMILIPGLASPPAVWDETIAHLGGKWQVHVLHLSGFAGQAPVPAPLVATVRRELADYIRANKLDHPVIVGHSLGGFLVLWLAATEPDLVGKVVAVDGVPFMPALQFPAATAEQAKPVAANVRDGMKKASRQDFEAQIEKFSSGMMTDAAAHKSIIDAMKSSNQDAVADGMYELLTTDIRPLLPQIKAPVLMILADSEYKDAATAQVEPIPSHQVVVVPKTKHFVMLDDPAGFFAALDTFLAK